jgi:hypothetical protein
LPASKGASRQAGARALNVRSLAVRKDLDADVGRLFVRMERESYHVASVLCDNWNDVDRLEQFELAEVLDYGEPGRRDPSRGGDMVHRDVERRGLADLAVVAWTIDAAADRRCKN